MYKKLNLKVNVCFHYKRNLYVDKNVCVHCTCEEWFCV